MTPSEDFYETLVHCGVGPVVTVDATDTIVFANRAVEETFGYDPETLVGEDVSLLVRSGRTTSRANDGGERVVPDGALLAEESGHLLVPHEEGSHVPATVVVREHRHEGDLFRTFRFQERSHDEGDIFEDGRTRRETIIDAIGDGIYTVDADGRMTWGNETVLEMTGYDRSELFGEYVTLTMEEEDVARGETLIRDLLAAPEAEKGKFEMDLVRADGTRIPCENHLALVTGPDGEFRGTVGILRDITERKAREAELARQKARLERFAGHVSHDLRNPLSAAQAQVAIAKEECDSDRLENLETLHGRMENLIADVLTLAKAGQVVGATDEVDLDAVVHETWATVDAGDATLVVDDDLGTMEADDERLRSLFENLLSNAVDHGGDSATVTVGRLDTGGFFVADDGPGIPEAEREAVLEYGHTTAPDGTGFGLSIVQSIAEAHGWTVTVTESDAGGARFEFGTE